MKIKCISQIPVSSVRSRDRDCFAVARNDVKVFREVFYFLWCAFLLAGCNLFQFDEGRYLPLRHEAALLRKYVYISHDANAVVFDLRVSVLSGHSQSDFDFYFQEEFQFEGEGAFQILEFEKESIIKTGNSSTILLIDQSGSYLETDPHNNRTKAMNKFLEDFTAPDGFMVGGFAEGGGVASPVEYSNENFVSDWADREFLFGLAARTGGSNSILNAVDHALDKLITVTTPRKELVILQHTPAGEEQTSFESVVNKAISSNVNVHILFFGAVPPPETWEVAERTGGILAVCPTDRDVITTFNHLHRLLNKNSSVNYLRIQFKPTGGNVVSGNEYEVVLRIKDKFSDFEFNPVYLKVKIP